MSLTGQRFAVKMAASQFPSERASIPAKSAIQNVLINSSLLGSKNTLIPTNEVSQQNTADELSNALKTKHNKDDGDYVNL